MGFGGLGLAFGRFGIVGDKHKHGNRPVNTVAPVVSGSRGGTLSCTTGTWTGDVVTITYAYQWYDAITDGGGVPLTDGNGNYLGTPIGGATSSTFSDSDTSQVIFCDVIATNGVGSVTKSSNYLAAVVVFGCAGTPIILSSPNDISADPPWAAGGLSRGTGALAPDGSNNASTGRANSTAVDLTQVAGTLTGATTYAWKGYIAPLSGPTWVRILFYDGGANLFGSYFNLNGAGSVGTAQNAGDGAVTCAQIAADAHGFFKISFAGQFTASHSVTFFIFYADADGSNTCANGQEFAMWQLGT